MMAICVRCKHKGRIVKLLFSGPICANCNRVQAETGAKP